MRDRTDGHASRRRRSIDLATNATWTHPRCWHRLHLQQPQAHAPQSGGVERQRRLALSAPFAQRIICFAAAWRYRICVIDDGMAMADPRRGLATSKHTTTRRLASIKKSRFTIPSCACNCYHCRHDETVVQRANA